MADRTPSTTIPLGGILITGQNVHNFKAGTTILAGHVVAIHGTGIDWTVWPAILGTTAVPIGVALKGATATNYVPVAGIGCICYVQNETNAVDIDAGQTLVPTDSAGLVGAAAVARPPELIAGVAVEDDDASDVDWVAMLVLCGLNTQVHS